MEVCCERDVKAHDVVQERRLEYASSKESASTTSSLHSDEMTRGPIATLTGSRDGRDAGTRPNVVSSGSGRGVSEYVNIENSEHMCLNFSYHSATMATKFEPMKNDLILRTARGR